MFKLSTKAVLAGSTAAVLGIGGAAFAFISATGSGSDNGTAFDLAANGQTLTLSLADPDDVTSPDVFNTGKQIWVDGTNNTEVPLTITDPEELRPTLSWDTSVCPPDSFVVVGTPALSKDEVNPGTTSAVGFFTLRFNNLPIAPGNDQAGCLGEQITFTWDGAPAPTTAPTTVPATAPTTTVTPSSSATTPTTAVTTTSASPV